MSRPCWNRSGESLWWRRPMESSAGSNLPWDQLCEPTLRLRELDRAEALARLKAIQAEVKEKQILSKSNPSYREVYAGELEAAQARAELAQVELDRLTLRAPFAGKIMALPVSSGQYVLKGTVIAELADITSLKSLVPVDRKAVSDRTDLKVFVEEQEQTAKVQSILPLPESYASLRELAAPFTAAWVVISNGTGELAPGLRVRSASLPITPIATVPKSSIKTTEGSAASNASIGSGLAERVRDQCAGRRARQDGARAIASDRALPIHRCADRVVDGSFAAWHTRPLCARSRASHRGNDT